MLSLLKISPRPTWSVFIITQNIKIILMSNQSHWKLIQLSQTSMFTSKANSKQKCTKKMQEREIGNDVTVQFR